MILEKLLRLAVFGIFAIALVFPLTIAAPATSFAVNSKQAACDGAGLTGADCSTGGGNKINNVLKSVINLISALVGVAAVIMVIVAGFKYVTSGGEASKVAGAKTTLVYAIVGIIIVALAQVIVHFVITSATA